MMYEDSEKHLKGIRSTRKDIDELKSDFDDLKNDLFWKYIDFRKMEKEVNNHHEDIIRLKHSIELIEYRIRRLEEDD